MDISSTTHDYLKHTFSDSVLMETQLRSLLIDWMKSEGTFVALPVTLTSGRVAIANFDTTVWPPWIRSGIREKLLSVGGVPSVSALRIQKDSKGNPYVLPVMNQVSTLPATTVEPATDDDVPA